jgi:hypothetical protein
MAHLPPRRHPDPHRLTTPRLTRLRQRLTPRPSSVAGRKRAPARTWHRTGTVRPDGGFRDRRAGRPLSGPDARRDRPPRGATGSGRPPAASYLLWGRQRPVLSPCMKSIPAAHPTTERPTITSGSLAAAHAPTFDQPCVQGLPTESCERAATGACRRVGASSSHPWQAVERMPRVGRHHHKKVSS